MDHREHWRGLCPRLHVEGDLDRAGHRFGRIDELLGDLRVEGYVHVPDVLPPEVVAPLRDCIKSLHGSEIPLPFAFVYDELWLIWQRLSHFISAALAHDPRRRCFQ